MAVAMDAAPSLATDVAARKRAASDLVAEGRQAASSVHLTKKQQNGLLLPKKKPRQPKGNVKILSTEDEAMMQQIRQITQGGYIEGLEALIVGRSIPTNLVDWISIKTIAEEILYNNEDDDVDENPHMNRQQTKKKKNKNKEDEIWENVLVIPTTEEKIQCCAHRYFTAISTAVPSM